MKPLLTIMLGFLFATSGLSATEHKQQAIFKIERSKNANIVQYDVRLGADGKLDRRKPVVAYWVRLAEEGQVKKLSWLQRRFVYGFKAKLDKGSDSVRLKMVAKFGRLIYVAREGGEYRASTLIDNAESWLDTIYIASSGDGMRARIDYIELHGVDKDSGEQRHERISP